MALSGWSVMSMLTGLRFIQNINFSVIHLNIPFISLFTDLKIYIFNKVFCWTLFHTDILIKKKLLKCLFRKRQLSLSNLFSYEKETEKQ